MLYNPDLIYAKHDVDSGFQGHWRRRSLIIIIIYWAEIINSTRLVVGPDETVPLQCYNTSLTRFIWHDTMQGLIGSRQSSRDLDYGRYSCDKTRGSSPCDPISSPARLIVDSTFPLSFARSTYVILHANYKIGQDCLPQQRVPDAKRIKKDNV